MFHQVPGEYDVMLNGIRLHYASCGERGRPLMLFLHGFPEYWGAWEELLPRFGDAHYAVAPDLRGFTAALARQDRKGIQETARRLRECGVDTRHIAIDSALKTALGISLVKGNDRAILSCAYSRQRCAHSSLGDSRLCDRRCVFPRLLVGKHRSDAFLWTRKLAQPSDT